jgi:8-oxo-dGTP pyrophosphatase MutT (NUDIX family)
VTLGGLSLIFKIAGAQKSFTVVETSLASKKPPLWNRVQLFSKRTDTHTNPSSLAYWMAKRLGAGESRARQIGWWGLLIEIPALCGMSSLAKDLTDRNIHVLSLLGLDPLTTGLVVVFFFLFAALHFTSAMEMNKRFGRDPPSQGILWMTMGVFLLYLVPGLWWFAVAVHLAFDMVHFSQAKLVPLDRRYLTAPEMLVGGRSITMVDPQMGHGKNIGTTSGRAILEFNGEWAVLLNPTGHWEFVGGGVGEKETIQEALPREIEEETGILKEKVLLHFLGDSTSDTAHFAYQYAKPGHDPVTRYVRVAMASFSRKPKIKISREHVKFKWVSPQTMREHLGDYTLNTRISLFLWILENEYGMRDVLSLIPLEHMTYARSTGPALLVKARSGDFVLHRAGMDVDGARFGVAFQQHLFDSGLPVPEVRERISAKGPERSPLLLLGGEPMVLERYLTAGKPIGRDQAEERHFTEIGKLVGKIQSVSENFIPPSGPFSSHSVNGDSVENRWLPLHGDLHFGNLHFDERDGTIAALFDFEHAKLGPRFEEILVSLYGSNKAEFREAYIKGFNETATTPLTEREVRRVLNGTLSHRTPSTLRWLWRGGSGVGALDAILNRARWETLPPVIAMGCVLLSGASLGWAGGVVLLTGAWGLAHFFGTYGVKEGHLVHWSGDVLASIPKALSWMWWISLFGGLLWGAGQVVPATMVPVVFALGTWGAAYVEMKRHADANRRWVADHVPGLTDEERGIARTILKNLEGRTSLLGVNEFSEWRTRTAQRVAVGPLGFKIDLSLPPVSLGQGPTLLLADEAMLNGKGLENLREWMRHDPNILLVAESVVAGISEERLLLVPSAFGPREGKIQAARTVSLATVRRSGVLHPWGLQTPFRLAQTPNLLLDASHLAENDPLKNAAENPLVILLETMRAFPAGPTHWSGVLKVLQAIAAFA